MVRYLFYTIGDLTYQSPLVRYTRDTYVHCLSCLLPFQRLRVSEFNAPCKHSTVSCHGIISLHSCTHREKLHDQIALHSHFFPDVFSAILTLRWSWCVIIADMSVVTEVPELIHR